MGDKIRLNVKTIIDSKVAFDDVNGNKLFNAILDATKGNGKTVVLDFKGIELVNTAFLNNAVGKLFDKNIFDLEVNRVRVENMDESKKELLKESISNAVKKYAV